MVTSCIIKTPIKKEQIIDIDNTSTVRVIPLTTKTPEPPEDITVPQHTSPHSYVDYENVYTVFVILGTLVLILCYVPILIVYIKLLIQYIIDFVKNQYNKRK